MSIQFNANQFERSFKPTVLRNWQVPKELCDKYPKRNKGATKIIANDRGHLLPEISKDKSKLWGNFIGTWQLPKKINKTTADELNGLSKKKQRRRQLKRKKGSQTSEIFKEVYEEPKLLSEGNNGPDEEIKSQPLPALETRPLSGVMPSGDMRCYHKKLTSPLLNAISNFSLAKKLHRENLEHDPLPDTIAHSMYCKLQCQRNLQHDPGLCLDEENYAKGIGWKGYPGYGPTKCTKLKVYRPKTGMNKKNSEDNMKNRPSTAINDFEKKWRFIRQSKVTPMELAICWDLTPENPRDEPKRTHHIDGSNGSQAPAIFSLVSTPKEDPTDHSDNNEAMFERSELAKEIHFTENIRRPKTSCSCDGQLNYSTNKDYLKRTKSAYNLNHQNEIGKKPNHQKSTPNLVIDEKNRRSCVCMTCENIKRSREKKSMNKGSGDFKMAFKAGVLQKSSKDKRQDYPEHWRLSTVYQQSYKPIAARKRPLLQTVFK